MATEQPADEIRDAITETGSGFECGRCGKTVGQVVTMKTRDGPRDVGPSCLEEWLE